MAYRQLLQQVATSTLVMWFLAGCIAPLTPSEADVSSATSTATAVSGTSEPTPTLLSSIQAQTLSSTPTSVVGANTGQWEGEPSVSFELTSNGDIHDFSIDVPLQLTGDDCPVRWGELVNAGSSIKHHDFQCMPDSTQFCSTKTVETDGTFTATALFRDFGTMTAREERWLKANNYWPTPVQTDVGEMYEANRISGKFDSATTIAGTYMVQVCGNLFIFPPEEGTWSAEWQEP